MRTAAKNALQFLESDVALLEQPPQWGVAAPKICCARA
jgi:hypothetical protein